MASPREQDAATCAGLAESTRVHHASAAAAQPTATTSDNGTCDSEGDQIGETGSATSPMASPPVSTPPPYWPVQHSYDDAAESAPETETGAITMRDNESEDRGGRNSACWARSVEIPDYVVVNGSATNIGAFVVFNVRVETMNGGYMNIRKRYSEFDDLRRRLMQTFPNFAAAVPPLPPKSLISKFRPPFLEKRRSSLQYFLNCILLNPEFSASPVLKEFLFA